MCTCTYVSTYFAMYSECVHIHLFDEHHEHPLEEGVVPWVQVHQACDLRKALQRSRAERHLREVLGQKRAESYEHAKKKKN